MTIDFLPVFRGSSDVEPNALDHVAHKATAVPVGLGRWHLALCIRAAYLQRQRSGLRRGDLRTPLAQAVRALITAQGGRLPAAPVVGRQLYRRHATIDAARTTP